MYNICKKYILKIKFCERIIYQSSLAYFNNLVKWICFDLQTYFCCGVFPWEDFKGTVVQDFQLLFFSWINPIWTPESYFNRFSNSVSNSNTPNLGYESRSPYGVDSWKKNRWQKISCYCPFNTSFWFPLKQTIVKIVFGWFLKHPKPRKMDYKVGELAGDRRELRNCGSQILKVRNRSSATFF